MPPILPRARRRLLTVRPPQDNFLDARLGAILDLRPAWRQAEAVIRELVVDEIRGKYWRPPSGRRRPWPKRKPFGSRTLPSDVFGPDYIAAWRGGPGAVREIKADRMAAGVDTRRFPWVKYHRPTLGPLRVTDIPNPAYRVSYLRQVTPWKLAKGAERRKGAQRYAVWWYLWLTYGVPLRDRTLARGLEVPARPHATLNPELRTRVTAILARHVADS